jgi:hypothetical protein
VEGAKRLADDLDEDVAGDRLKEVLAILDVLEEPG